ncbi:MAG: hypothetical protein E6I72_08595 [Chloroflexi bacterium]|nr:MAG: hypothetical protein E6I72_08595 [Chloroflexota bacterium]
MAAILLAAGIFLGIVGLTAWRPGAGCALIALAVPLTAGLGRDTLLPLLRPSEALVMSVLAGVLLNRLWRPRPLYFSGLDLAVFGFSIGSVLIPTLVLLLTRIQADLDTWRTIMAPVQYLAVYLVFSRSQLSPRATRITLNLMMLASIVVGVVAVAELVEPNVRTAVAVYYDTPVLPSWDPVYRPTSLLGHFSAVGAFGLMSCTLALALAAARVPGFNGVWLSLVMLVNIASLLASETWAPLVALPAVVVLILVYSRRIPPHVWMVLGTLAVSALLLWPFLNERVDQQQLLVGGGSGVAVPATLEWRIRYWQEFFIPAAADNLWFGSGTTIPSMVPEAIDTFVDNEYLYAVFRAGLLGVGLLLGVFAVIGVVGWRERFSPSHAARAMGAVALATVIAMALMGATSEYLTFAAVSQLFWMQVGLLASLRTPELARSHVVVLRGGLAPDWPGRPEPAGG